MAVEFFAPVFLGRGQNVSGVYIKEQGYVLVYSVRDNIMYERKYTLASGNVEDQNGTPVSYSQALSRSGGIKVEHMGGRLVNGR